EKNFDNVLIAFGKFLQRLISVKRLTLSPMTSVLLSRNNKDLSMDISTLLKKLHGRCAQTVSSIWKHPSLTRCSVQFRSILIHVVAQLTKGIEGASIPNLNDTTNDPRSISRLASEIVNVRQREEAFSVDPDALSQITEMGFSERRARQA